MIQTTTLATSKKLWELGVRVDSYFAHFDIRCNDEGYQIQPLCSETFTNDTKSEDYHAYTLCELWDVFPATIKEGGKEYVKTLQHTFGGTSNGVFYRVTGGASCMTYSVNHSENIAEAAGLMLIWLIENGYLKAEDVND